MKKVLHIIVGLNAGGAEMLLVDLVRNSKHLFYSEVIILGDYFDLLDRVESAGVKVHQFNIDKSIIGFRKGLKSLAKILNNQDFDVVHTHMYHGLMLATWYHIFYRKINIAFTPNNVSFKSRYRDLFVRLMKSKRKADILFGESMIKNIYRDDYKIITNAINTRKFDLDENKYDELTFIQVGRLEPQKNHLHFLDIIREVKEQRKNFRVCIIGKGELETPIKNKIEKLGIGDVVEMWGYRTDIAEICNRAHVFIMPSLWEGLPVSMLEAGASGLLVFCTPVGSIPDYITEDTGVLSSIEEFSNNMIKIIDDYDELKVKGDNLKKKIFEDFDISSIAQKHLELYKEIS